MRYITIFLKFDLTACLFFFSPCLDCIGHGKFGLKSRCISSRSASSTKSCYFQKNSEIFIVQLVRLLFEINIFSIWKIFIFLLFININSQDQSHLLSSPYPSLLPSYSLLIFPQKNAGLPSTSASLDISSSKTRHLLVFKARQGYPV